MEPTRARVGMFIPGTTREIISRLVSRGHVALIVGGAVRDTVMGLIPKDFDIATDASTEEVVQALSGLSGVSFLQVGRSFGITMVVYGGERHEVATFRRDVGSGRRPPRVESASIAEDAARRDLTINAMYYDVSSGDVIDYVGGLDDAAARRVRTVGRPSDRLAEDPLRALRIARFAARFDSDVDLETADAVRQCPDLVTLSRERVCEEFKNGVVSADSVEEYVDLLCDLGLMDTVFPGGQVTRPRGPLSRRLPVLLASLLFGMGSKEACEYLHAVKFSSVVDPSEVAVLIDVMSARTPEDAVRVRKAIRRTRLCELDVKELWAYTHRPEEAFASCLVEMTWTPDAISAQHFMSKGLRGEALGAAIDEANATAFQSLLDSRRRWS